jgi:glycosyltransferase involved in cell wall biosynthesis
VIQNGVSGYLETNSTALVAHMRRLLLDPGEAQRLGQAARHYARERFNIARFTRDWDAAFADVTGNTP